MAASSLNLFSWSVVRSKTVPFLAFTPCQSCSKAVSICAAAVLVPKIKLSGNVSFIIYGSGRFGIFPIPSNTFLIFSCLLRDTDSVQRNLEELEVCHSPDDEKSILLSIRNVLDHTVFSTVLPNVIPTFLLQHQSSSTT